MLVGDEPYYGKSGFKRIPKGRATMPGPVDPARLLVCELVEGAFDGVSGADPAGLDHGLSRRIRHRPLIISDPAASVQPCGCLEVYPRYRVR